MSALSATMNGTLPSTSRVLLRHRSQAFPAPLSGHQSLCRALGHSERRASDARGLQICRAASSVRIIIPLFHETSGLVHGADHLAVVQVATQEAPLSTFAQQEGLLLPLGSEGAWDEEALGHPVVGLHQQVCNTVIPSCPPLAICCALSPAAPGSFVKPPSLIFKIPARRDAKEDKRVQCRCGALWGMAGRSGSCGTAAERGGRTARTPCSQLLDP